MTQIVNVIAFAVALKIILIQPTSHAFIVNNIDQPGVGAGTMRHLQSIQVHRQSPLFGSSNGSNEGKTSFNDAFLNALENEGYANQREHNINTNTSNQSNHNKNDIIGEQNYIDPPPDSLAALRDLATTNVANFLATLSQPSTMDDDNVEKVNYSTIVEDNELNGTIKDKQKAMNDQKSLYSRNNISPMTPPPSQTNSIHWDVYVCQSKQCIERGAAATLDSFQALVPSTPMSSLSSSQNVADSHTVQNGINTSIRIHPAILSRSKAKGPNVRCIQRTPPYKAFEVNNVNDIDKVYRILTKHMSIINISKNAKDCLKYTYQGNSHLEKNELSQAIQSYNLALEQNYSSQEGMILLLRATAYLKRAFQHQEVLRATVSDLGKTVSDPAVLGKLYSIAEDNPSLAKGIFQKVLMDTKAQDKKFRLTKYRHGLYEYSLLHAAQDSLRSTQLLPHHAKTWLRAGDALAELRKLKESALYYEKAMELDPTLRSRLEPVVERLNRSQEFLDKARGWWSNDTLRLALDVAG